MEDASLQLMIPVYMYKQVNTPHDIASAKSPSPGQPPPRPAEPSLGPSNLLSLMAYCEEAIEAGRWTRWWLFMLYLYKCELLRRKME